jgi:hypothetical protein
MPLHGMAAQRVEMETLADAAYHGIRDQYLTP